MNTGKVSIELNALHKLSEGSENMTQELSGVLLCEGDKRIIQYREESEDGDVIINTLQLFGNEARLKKKGAAIWDVCFVPGEDTQSVYRTPFGDFDMQIHTLKVATFEAEDQLRIRIAYELRIAGGEKDVCQLSLMIRQDA